MTLPMGVRGRVAAHLVRNLKKPVAIRPGSARPTALRECCLRQALRRRVSPVASLSRLVNALTINTDHLLGESHAHTHAGFLPVEPPNGRRLASIFILPSPPPPPPPKAEEAKIQEDRCRRRLAEARRFGSYWTIPTGGEGDMEPATVTRPELRRLLGGR